MPLCYLILGVWIQILLGGEKRLSTRVSHWPPGLGLCPRCDSQGHSQDGHSPKGLLVLLSPREPPTLGHLWQQECGSGRCDCPWDISPCRFIAPGQPQHPWHCPAQQRAEQTLPPQFWGSCDGTESCLHWWRKQRTIGLHKPPAIIGFFLPFLVKKQFSNVGLSPEPPDTLTSHPVLTPQRGTSPCCWFPCRPPPLVLTGSEILSWILNPVHDSSQDLGWLRWWDRALFTATTMLCPSQIGMGTWAGCSSLRKGASFSPKPTR